MARPSSRPGNLPAETSSFIGRRGELAELRRALTTSRLVTLVGPGGVGKSRLALRIGTDLARGFRDGAWLVELADVRDPSLVDDVVLASLDLRDLASPRPRDRLLEQLRSRELLLLVDNCEHLLEAASALVFTILQAAPRVRIIATSREPLSIPGEHVLPVPPLELPRDAADESLDQLRASEAVGLFVERAAAAVGRFDLTAANRAAVVDVCRRLDGLPLAIELAAVRTRVLSPQQIEERLADRFGLLAGGSAVVAPRHQALRATVAWSHDLLDHGEQAGFRRLCVFAGRFTLADAEAVVAGGDLGAGAVLDVMASLVEKSLVLKEEVAGQPCFRLHETMREFAALELRAAAETDEVERRFADHVIDACGRAAPQARFTLVAWLGWIDIEIDNVRAVLRRCQVLGESDRGMLLTVALAWFWATRATAEGVRWLDAFLGQGSAGPDAKAAARFMRGFLGLLQADPVQARAFLEQAASANRAAGHARALVNALAMASVAASMTGDRASAGRLVDEARDQARVLDDAEADAAVLQAQALDGMIAGDLDAVRAMSMEGARLSRAAGDLYTLGIWLLNHGIAALLQGRSSLARTQFTEGLPLACRIDDRVAQHHLLHGFACLAAGSGQARLAAQLLGAADTVRSGAGAQVMPFLAPLVEGARVSASATLGPAAFEAAFTAGTRLRRDDAVRLALGKAGEAVDAGPPGPDSGILSRREAEVARLVAEGLTNKEIGSRLFISEHTVDSHVRAILDKLGVDSRARIATWVVALGA